MLASRAERPYRSAFNGRLLPPWLLPIDQYARIRRGGGVSSARSHCKNDSGPASDDVAAGEYVREEDQRHPLPEIFEPKPKGSFGWPGGDDRPCKGGAAVG